VFLLTCTPPESAPSGQFWGISALIGGVRVKVRIYPLTLILNTVLARAWLHIKLTDLRIGYGWMDAEFKKSLAPHLLRWHL